MRYELYIDVYVITNFFFDYLVLFLIREIRHKRSGIFRMAGMAFLGAVCSAAAMLLVKNAGWYRAFVHLLINPLMFYLCFHPKSRREFLVDYAAGYLLMMLTGGCVQWVFQITGSTAAGLAVLAAVMIVFLGLERGKQAEDQIFDLSIYQSGRELHIRGFLDTGNLLMDPYVGLPVSLIGRETLEKLMEAELPSYRFIPFSSLGEEHGMVRAVTVEALCIKKKDGEVWVRPAVLAVTEEGFLDGKEYQVILNGRLW